MLRIITHRDYYILIGTHIVLNNYTLSLSLSLSLYIYIYIIIIYKNMHVHMYIWMEKRNNNLDTMNNEEDTQASQGKQQ